MIERKFEAGAMLRAKAIRELIVKAQLERSDNICIQTDDNTAWKANLEDEPSEFATKDGPVSLMIQKLVFYRKTGTSDWESAEPSDEIRKRLNKLILSLTA